MQEKSFLIQNAWNNVTPKDWPYKARKHMRPSEIGMPFIDRWCSMNAIPITNPFTQRTLRIFQAGNVIEYIVLRSLALSGLLHSSQQWLELKETPEHLGMKGRLDATIGGFVDWDDARRRVDANLAEFAHSLDEDVIAAKSTAIIEDLKKRFPKGFKEQIIVEVKSINSMAFHNSKGNKDSDGDFKGYDHNKAQLYSYLEMAKTRVGLLVYISKDDFCMAEVPVRHDDKEVADAFWHDIQEMSRLYRADEMPKKEPEISFNQRNGKFETNWSVGRSLYLTYLYGYESQDAYEKSWHYKLLDVNRALRHLRVEKVKKEDIPVIEEWKLNDFVKFEGDGGSEQEEVDAE